MDELNTLKVRDTEKGLEVYLDELKLGHVLDYGLKFSQDKISAAELSLKILVTVEEVSL